MSSITFTSGRMRSGKTISIAIRALILADSGLQIYSNFSLFDQYGKGVWDKEKQNWSGNIHPNVKIITPYDLVLLLEGGRRENKALIALQEVYGWFNSHKSLSDINDLEDTFVFQSGKLGYDWDVDTQLTSRVDGALRKLASLRYEAERNEELKLFGYYELDRKETEQDVHLEDDYSYVIPDFLASEFWDRYDTYEPTQPIGLADTKLKMQKLVPELKDRTITEQTEMILANVKQFGIFSFMDVTPIAITDALTQLHLPVGFAQNVAYRVKRRLKYGL